MKGVPASPRYRDCIDVAWGARIASFPVGTPMSVLTAGYWVNPSQGVQRKPWGAQGVLTTGGLWYSFAHDLALDSRDALRIAGMPSLIETAGLSEPQLKELSGEHFSMPIVSLCIAAVYYWPWGQWWDPDISGSGRRP
jgi:hypothetical protein